MFKKLLIANRGEISCRVIKTARRMGIATVAVYSDADANALHVQLADEAVNIGPAPSRESYLRGDAIIDIAVQLGVDAIHPGYGFLSENAGFAKACADNGITFVGPPTGAIQAMGSKSAAKKIMEDAGVPLVPGYHGDNQTPSFLKAQADEMGYPVLLKAAAGGGGKGMRQVWQSDEFDEALAAAKREALSSFDDDLMLVEKYLTQPRHVEIQVFCDSHNNGVYLFERDCSVQRRHQKIIEEAPAPGMTEDLRQQMGEAALRAAAAIGYEGAGTVEFLLDEDGSFYFMEMNTRLQVEHPVTEMISRQDLVEWQLRVASGEPLPCTQNELKIHGHAVEARIYAEDPDKDFLPSTGTLHLLRPPVESEHVRVDTGVSQGDEVSVYYDPMIAKLIVWDESRDKAMARMAKALSEYHIEGVTTNIDFLYNLSTNEAFKAAQLTTGFIAQHNDDLFVSRKQDIEALLPLAALYLTLSKEQQSYRHSQDHYSPWHMNNDWRANETHQQIVEIAVQDTRYTLQIERAHSERGLTLTIHVGDRRYQCEAELERETLIATVNGHKTQSSVVTHDNGYTLFTPQTALRFDAVSPDLGLDADQDGDDGFNAPMNGTIVAVLVSEGQSVEKGDSLMVMEAMKMEHAIRAPSNGKVSEFFFQQGELVDGGATLLAFEAEE